MPEPDLLTHQALGKLAEEVNELGSIIARCLIQGLNESEPETGKPNREKLAEEMADVEAALLWVKEVVGGDGPPYDKRVTALS